MAGPDNSVRRDDGIIRARIEARNADPEEFDILIKKITTKGEWTDADGETHEWGSTFPVIELRGYNKYDKYRFATPGTSWTEDQVVDEELLEKVLCGDEAPPKPEKGTVVCPHCDQETDYWETAHSGVCQTCGGDIHLATD